MEVETCSTTRCVRLFQCTVGLVCLLVAAHSSAELYLQAGLRRHSDIPFDLGEYVSNRKIENPFFNRQGGQSAPITLVVPCESSDFRYLPIFLESLANQTVAPSSTHLVLTLSPNAANGTPFLLIGDQAGERPEALTANFPLRTKNWTQALDYVRATRVPLKTSFRNIQNLVIHIRSGVHYAGDNRMYGVDKSVRHHSQGSRDEESLVSFIDCDDYLHPQRTELVYKTFLNNSDLEALIHGYTTIPLTRWDEVMPAFLQERENIPDKLIWSYAVIHERLPVSRFVYEPQGEPRQSRDSVWWFPKDMDLPYHPTYSPWGHNGWLTIKRRVLTEVPYPQNVSRGQDSLYNYRLIRARKNFNVLPVSLAGYVREK
eukprot:Blabericola_migrator_1__715@NODE_1178_length_5203_cov_57_765576_g801_i0_p3_GENE_NODE_1178_length_5203_cov_57_765576_g801_i0NODE_1178_length_5203_cov_57_765576_g801_i0_p3_ORF_typecomplete_len372_score22_53Glycos_transf_2/PF00535_26/9_2e02Glycos_transf_2/PF00535_26/0_84_NODE_1178_length_5203_cov_57_765576_g801_i031774292